MDAFALVVMRVGAGEVVLPRRLSLHVRPGDGRLLVNARAALSPRWRDSVAAGWEAARDLSGRGDADGELQVGGDGPLDGESAGLPFALLATYALLGRAVPRYFATGAVRRPHGALEGGLAVAVKARAVPPLAAQLGVASPCLLTPPLADPPSVDGVAILPAPDLGGALARLDPETYALVRARHEDLRAAAASRRLD